MLLWQVSFILTRHIIILLIITCCAIMFYSNETPANYNIFADKITQVNLQTESCKPILSLNNTQLAL